MLYYQTGKTVSGKSRMAAFKSQFVNKIPTKFQKEYLRFGVGQHDRNSTITCDVRVSGKSQMVALTRNKFESTVYLCLHTRYQRNYNGYPSN